jgi:hypothetical protein
MKSTELESFISSFDEKKSEAEGATVFLLRPIPTGIFKRIADEAISYERQDDGTPDRFYNRAGTRNYLALKWGLKGWRNFNDASGAVIEYTTVREGLNGRMHDVVSDDALDAVPLEIRNELAAAILAKNTMFEAMRKKSNTPS